MKACSKLLLFGLLLSSCASTVKPRQDRVSAPIRFWSLRDAGATKGRLAELGQVIRRCEAGLEPYFAAGGRARPRPLTIIAYRDRRSFVRGLEQELGFSGDQASYFARNSAPRPIDGKMLVPPDQSPINVCHELVHHYLESQVSRARLLEAKWFDEGTATYLAAVIFEPHKIRERIGWFRSRRRYLPLYRIRDEQGWSTLHRDPRDRGLAYMQAMALVQHFLRHRSPGVLRAILQQARSGSIDSAFVKVAGTTVEDLFRQWLDRTRASWEPRRFDGAEPRPGFLPRARPEEVGLAPKAVQRLVEAAARARSDTLIVIRDGRVVVERHFLDEQGPIETMSVTKSIVSLAVGLLIAEGKLSSVEAPISTWLPEWREGAKAKVTLRHVLTHTSGLKHAPAAGVINRQRDRTRYARELPLVQEPGRRFSYNNEATQLLSEVVHKAAGEPMDRYLERRLLRPLGITSWRWERDRAGNVQAFYGLALGARDLARVGLLMLERGRAKETQLVPEAWIRSSTSPGIPAFPRMGLLWWLRHKDARWLQTPARLARLQRFGLRLAPKLRPLSGRLFPSPAAYWLEAGARLNRAQRAALRRWVQEGKDAPVTKVPADLLGFNANGWQGQYLAVYPRWKLVVVRQRRPITYTEEENKRYGLWSFFKLVEGLVKTN